MLPGASWRCARDVQELRAGGLQVRDSISSRDTEIISSRDKLSSRSPPPTAAVPLHAHTHARTDALTRTRSRTSVCDGC